MIKPHIIEIASRLFYSNGYHSTGINEIIEKADIAKATLYHHFRSKEDICIAYLNGKHEEFMSQLKKRVANATIGQGQLLAIFDYLREFYRSDEFNGCWGQRLLGELNHNHAALLGVLQDHKKELLDYLALVVNGNIANISKAEKERVSGGLYMLYESAITESHLHKNDWPIFMAKSIAPALYANMRLLQGHVA